MDATGSVAAISRAGAKRHTAHATATATKAAVVLLVVVYLVLVLTGVVTSDARLGWLDFGLVALVLLYAGGILDRIRELSIGKDGIRLVRDLRRRQEDLGLRQERNETTLVAMSIALTGLVNKYEYGHLKSLMGPGPYLVHWSEIFFGEIERLDSVGFVRPLQPRGCRAIKEDHAADATREFDLKTYVEITDEGRTYVDQRREVEGFRFRATGPARAS